MTVAQIINFLLINSDLNLRKQGKPPDHSDMILIKSLRLYSGSDNQIQGIRSEELWMEVPNIVQEAVIKTIPKKKKSNSLS